MDFLDPTAWKESVGVLMQAPRSVAFLIGAAASVAWRFKSKTTQSVLDEKTERVGVLEERLRLWKEREEDIRQKLDESEKKRDDADTHRPHSRREDVSIGAVVVALQARFSALSVGARASAAAGSFA
jgi:hypothetical protein